MKQKVFQDINVKSFMEKYFVVLEKNIDTDELPDGFQYFGIPTMFFINNKGEQVEKFIGSSRAEPFLNNLKKIIKEKQ
jgi:thioredoxin-related protein